MNYLNVLAKALYDNVAESPDELSFRKGDIMTVLERNTQGLDGWWLCSLHGRQGIVPGNRLKILVGMLPGPAHGQPQPSLQPQPPQQQAGQTPLAYPHQGGYSTLSPASQYTSMHPSYLPQEDNVYLVPPPNKAPGGLQQGSGPVPGQFQSPPGKQPSTYQSPPQGQDVYQVPAGPASPPQDIYQVPPSMDGRGWDAPKAPGKGSESFSSLFVFIFGICHQCIAQPRSQQKGSLALRNAQQNSRKRLSFQELLPKARACVCEQQRKGCTAGRRLCLSETL